LRRRLVHHLTDGNLARSQRIPFLKPARRALKRRGEASCPAPKLRQGNHREAFSTLAAAAGRLHRRFRARRAGPAHALLSKEEVKCLAGLNTSAIKVHKMIANRDLSCIKGIGKDTLGVSNETCFGLDGKQKIIGAEQKFSNVNSDLCQFSPPAFGNYYGTRILGGVRRVQPNLRDDVFGEDLDTNLVKCSTDPALCACQGNVDKAVARLVSTELKLFLACNKKNLAVANSDTDLARCISDPLLPASLAADTSEKIAKQAGKIAEKAAKYCPTPAVSLASAFPGACSASPDSATLAACLANRVDCRVCRMLNEMEGTNVDCDDFDDATNNASCVLPFAETQNYEGFPITCTSVENTGTYTQCNGIKADIYSPPNGVLCLDGFSSTPSPLTDHGGLCNFFTGTTNFEAYYACDVTQNRSAWNAHFWTFVMDNGYTRDLRCYY